MTAWLRLRTGRPARQAPQGIVHRDLKPHNVVVVTDDQGRLSPKLVDFGLAKVLEGSMNVTGHPTLLGTPRYMAPEQITPTALVGPGTDQFALAAMTFELLAGEPLFRGESIAALAYQIVNEDPSVRIRLLDTPAHWHSALARALAKRPDDRFASVREFADTLADRISASSTARPGRSRVVTRRIAVLGGALAALVGVPLVGVLRRSARQPARPVTGSTAAGHSAAAAALPPARPLFSAPKLEKGPTVSAEDAKGLDREPPRGRFGRMGERRPKQKISAVAESPQPALAATDPGIASAKDASSTPPMEAAPKETAPEPGGDKEVPPPPDD